MTYNAALMQAQARTGTGLDNSRTMGLLNAALVQFWSAFPWEQSLGNGYSFALVPYRESYSPPFVQIPSDFRNLYSGSLWAITATGTSKEYVLETAARRARRSTRGIPEWMSYSEETNGFRFDRVYWNPQPSGLWVVEYRYKRTTPVLSRSDLESDFPIAVLFQSFVKLLATYLIPGQGNREILQLREAILFQAAQEAGLLESPDFISPHFTDWNLGC